MNRLAIANRHVAGIAATMLLLTSMDAFAQFQLPAGTTPAMPTTPTKTASGPQLITEARRALARKDYQAAVQAFRKAASSAPASAQEARDIAILRQQLVAVGFDAQLLAPPAAPAQPAGRLPGIAGSQPTKLAGGAPNYAQPIGARGASNTIADPAARKREALRLVAIGRAALDRGDANTALAMAKQAEQLKVPNEAFAPNEPRVWQLMLDAESAVRRRTVALTSGQLAVGGVSPVQQAVATAPTNEANTVAQMLFAAEADNKAGTIAQVQNEAPLPGGTISNGQKLYNDGMEALSKGDKATARQFFLEAWNNASDLDPAIRNQLKDKLTLLQPVRTPNAGSPANMTAIERAELEAQEKTRRLYREVTAELAKANESKQSDPLNTLEGLERLRRRVDSSDISEQSRRTIAVLVDRAINEQKRYNEAHRAEINLDLKNESIRTEIATQQARQESIDAEVATLVESFNELMTEKRYHEAVVVAKQVAELKPGDPIATQMTHNSTIATRKTMEEEVQAKGRVAFLDVMRGIEESAKDYDPTRELTFEDPEVWANRSTIRLQGDSSDSHLSVAEQAIKQKLTTPVEVKYNNRPLGEVIDDLSNATGIPMVIDTPALSTVRVTADTPVSLSINTPLALKSALNLLLEKQLQLTYTIENDVLNITSIEAKRSKVYPKTYRVTDLVTPIPNFTSSYEQGLAGALRAAYQMSNPQNDVRIMPVSMTDLGTGMAQTPTSANLNPAVLGQYAPMGSQGGFGLNNPPGGGAGGAGGGAFADFQSLIDLIQTTVVPDTWEVLGGPSTMAPYPQNLSLVISTTSDVHDQISDLLESLRALQNLQITIEVRFITLSDSFFEQIGVDFNVQFDDNVTNFPTGEDEGPAVTVGLGGDGLPTADLDIRFDNGSFGTLPPFGGFDAGAASTIGFAMLSDIETFFFLQAAQGDNRNNIMQAPKVTLFDGQFANIQDVTQRPFVTSITPVVGDFAVAQQPVIVVLNEGTQLNVQGIVSDDKRFVRLTLVPFFSQIGDVDTFTYEGRRTTSRSSRNETGDTNGDGVVDDDDAVNTEEDSDITEGTTVQLPTFSFTTVSTTVSVPDGGTILLGGIKRLAEGRTERGVPMLSKIPYVSRLFRNVSVGRDARSLMLMVTPRIIIEEEEEFAQTGFKPNR